MPDRSRHRAQRRVRESVSGHAGNLKVHPPSRHPRIHRGQDSRRPRRRTTTSRRDAPAPERGAPTPTRAEQEAARKRPLVADTKEAKARARAELAAQREKARVGMAAGDEQLPPGPRQGPAAPASSATTSTSGWHLGEAVMPAMVARHPRHLHPDHLRSSTTRSSRCGSSSCSSIGDMVITSIRVKQRGARQVRRGPHGEGPRLVRRDAHRSRCGSCACPSRRSSAASTRPDRHAIAVPAAARARG